MLQYRLQTIVVVLIFASLMLCSLATFSMEKVAGERVKLQVAVAANFHQTMAQLKPMLEGQDLQLTLVSASTGTLFQQIRHGAPFDVLLAADAERPAALEAHGLILPDTRHTYAVGQLALWSRQPNINVKDLLTEANTKIAVADPRLAPYGKATKEALRSLELWASVSNRLVRGRDISQAFLFAVSGQAVAAFISKAQAIEFAQNAYTESSIWHISTTLHQPIQQQVVGIARSKQPAAVREFINRLLSEEARQVIRSAGYITQAHPQSLGQP